MKKFKLFALAAFAMLSTNAFAYDLISGQHQTVNGVEYTVMSVYKTTNGTTKINTVSAKANSFEGTALTLEPTVSFNVQGTDDDGVAISTTVEFNVVAIEADGFSGNSSLTSVTLPTSIESIGDRAFMNCQSLATFTVPTNSKLGFIGAGALANTAITKLDLSGATKAQFYDEGQSKWVVTGMTQFGWDEAEPEADPNWTSPFMYVDAEAEPAIDYAVNAVLLEVVLPTTCTELGADVFNGCKNLKTIDLKNVIKIGASAFENCVKLTSVKIGTAHTFGNDDYGIAIASEAFAGCTKLATVELGLIKVGDEDGIIAEDAFAFDGCAITNFKFNDIKTALPAVFNIASVTQLDFQSYIGTAGFIPSESFTDAFDEGGIINYNIQLPTGVNTPVKAFAIDAFGDEEDELTITMNTIAKVEQVYLAEGLYKVSVEGNYSEDPLVIGNADGKLLGSGSSFYYYFPVAVGDKFEIAKIQENGAKVNVYQAYIDIADDEATCYMLPLFVNDGKYVVEGVAGVSEDWQVFIVKSNKEYGVVYTASDDDNTMLYNDGHVKNDLQWAGGEEDLSIVSLMNGVLEGGDNDLYFMNNPATSGFGFTKFDATKQTGGLGKTAVFMICEAVDAARLNVVWLDEDDATAIKTIKAKAGNNGAIYNLAGQKVNAAYKGVVIKDGKKYIQK